MLMMRDLYPCLGSHSINQIKPLAILQEAEAREELQVSEEELGRIFEEISQAM